MSNLKKNTTYLAWISVLLLAACSGPAPALNTPTAPAPSAPAASAPAAVEASASPQVYLPSIGQSYPYPSQEALPLAYPMATDPVSATAYPALVETPVEQASAYPVPASPETVPATLEVSSPASMYTCDLQGSKLPIWRVEVVNTYPHDANAYTQGLIFRDNLLYEGTGLRGRSSLRKDSLENGEVLQKVELPEEYFGEGITEMGGKIYQITWQEKTGFVYDFATLEKIGEFSYDTEGWGLTHDGQQLIMSDGTNQLYFIDPTSLKVTGNVSVADDRGPVYRINELEYVEDEVWGNIYQTSCVARIDPKSGQVTGWIDLAGLHDLALQGIQGPVPPEVPNGIAYDPASKKLYVTGKLWPSLFEITLTPVEAQP